jgi:hypothetical protein
MFGLPFRRNNNYIGAYYMLKMYQQVMLETNTKVFADVTLKKDLLWFLSSLYYSFFRNVSKTNYDNHTSLENILTQINRIN